MDKLIVSYHDSCLYQSDLKILQTETEWLSDRIITFWFEYLQKEIHQNELILFIGPEVTQAIKLMNSPEEVNAIFFDHLNVSSRSFVIFAVNNNSTTQAGGSHWSLCVFSKADNAFYHFDSSSGSNYSACSSLVRTLKTCFDCETAEIKQVDCLQQTNCYDCGIFVLCHTDLVCQTIEKNLPLSSIKKLQPKKVHVKRSETAQLVQNMSLNI